MVHLSLLRQNKCKEGGENMKEAYETLKMEVIHFDVEDIITTSPIDDWDED